MPFTNAPWSTPESSLTPEQFCRVCLSDLNPSGQEKRKANCHLPVRATVGGPYNKNAVRNAMARLTQTKIPGDAKRRAARLLLSLAREAGIEVGATIKRLAGAR